MNRLSAREQRLIALAILVGVIALAWIAVVSPIVRGFADRREARAIAVADIQRNARLISSFGAVRGEAAALRRALGVYALSAASPPAAIQAARERLARAVASQAGTLQALRNQPSPAELVRLQADMRITLAGLVGLLHQLEDGRPYAVVDALSVTTGDAAAGPLAPLEIRLEISYSYAG